MTDNTMWQCPSCYESVDATFEICWNCGTLTTGESDPGFKQEEQITNLEIAHLRAIDLISLQAANKQQPSRSTRIGIDVRSLVNQPIIFSIILAVLAWIVSPWLWSNSQQQAGDIQDNAILDNNLAAKSTSPVDKDGQFEQVLNEVDEVIGKRVSFSRTDATVQVSYVYGGSINPVVDVIGDWANQLGFTPSEDQISSEGSAETVQILQDQLGVAMTMNVVDSKEYQDSDGNSIVILRADFVVEEENISLLQINMTNTASLILEVIEKNNP